MYNHLVQYYLEPDEQTKEALLDKAAFQYQLDEDARNAQLQAFINDFIQSEEYETYLEQKNLIQKRTIGVQYSFTRKMRKHFQDCLHPLTAESKKISAFAQNFSHYVSNKITAKIVEKQKEGIKIIREKIDEARQFFRTKKSAQYLRDEETRRVILEYCEKFHVDLSKLKEKNRRKVADKILCCQRIFHTKRQQMKENMLKIIRKLLNEYARKIQIEQEQNKSYDYKVKSKERILPDMEVVGSKIILSPREPLKIPEVITEEIAEEPSVHLEEEKPTKLKKKPRKLAKDRTSVTKKSKKKKDGTSKTKTSKATKISQNKAELILPFIPIINKRAKIEPDVVQKMCQLADDFREFDEYLENQMVLGKTVDEDSLYPMDENFYCEPSELFFQNFSTEKIYRRRVRIINKGSFIRKCKVLKESFQDPYDAVYFKVMVEAIGIKKLAPGCCFNLTITFTPKDNHSKIQGKILFLSYDPHICQYSMFRLPIQCIPRHSNLSIKPHTVSFGQIPIWQAKKHAVLQKTIKFRNEGLKPCTLVVKKMEDLLELAQYMEVEPEDMSSNADLEVEPFVRKLTEECFNNVFNTFTLEQTYFTLEALEEKLVKVKFAQFEYIGNFFENYLVDVYEREVKDNSLSCVGCQELSLFAELTGHFIQVLPDTIDYGVCFFNSRYQIPVTICNSSSHLQTVSVRFPSNLSDYVQADTTNIFVPPQDNRRLLLKFAPSRRICVDDVSYYDPNTAILEFPVHFCVASRNYKDIPPVKLTCFAVLTNPDDLVLRPRNHAKILDLGECSIFETVVGEIELMNTGLLPQVYCFLDLPPCISIQPNDGVGEILPLESKICQVVFQPEVEDIAMTSFWLTVDTVANRRQTKKVFNKKRFRTSVEMVIKELRKPHGSDSFLVDDMQLCLYALQHESKLHLELKESLDVVREAPTPTPSFQGSVTDYIRNIGEHFGEGEDLDEGFHKFPSFPNSERRLCVRVKTTRPLCQFSYQLLEFPSTPCGSYSTIEVELRALEDPRRNFEAKFEITGENEQIVVEPTCGTLRCGQAIKVMLLAKPNLPEELVSETAQKLKYTEVYQRKLEERQALKLQELERALSRKKPKKKEATKRKVRGKAKESKKKGKKKPDVQPVVQEVESEIVVEDSELEINFEDLFPAEMHYWRAMKPFKIHSKFTCKITYDKYPQTDLLYLEAVCKVIPPHFVTNLHIQRLDFSGVVIGMDSTKTITIQNINYASINPEWAPMNPIGCFWVPTMRNLHVPPEHYLKIPVTFTPDKEKVEEEFLEIRSGNTRLSLILSGEGLEPNIEILPEFLVVRIDCSETKVAKCPLEITNHTSGDIVLTVEKVCELEGTIEEYEKLPEIPKEYRKGTSRRSSASQGTNKTNKKSPQGKITVEKYSNELTINEIESLKTNFNPVDETQSHFEYFDLDSDDQVTLSPDSNRSVTIGFGKPDVLQRTKMEMEETRMKRELKARKKNPDKGKKIIEKKGGKKKKKKEEVKSKGSKKTGKKSGTEGSKVGLGKKKRLAEKYFVAKFNVFLGKGRFLRDVIVIANFT